MVFESSSERRKKWDGRKMTGSAFKIFGATDENDLEACHGGFAQRNTY